jgi:molybdopterin converting factor small subunit
MAVDIKVLFFGATAVEVGQRVLELSVPENSTADSGFELVVDKFPQLKRHKLLHAINQHYAAGDEVLCEGDELAIFTAVSGG